MEKKKFNYKRQYAVIVVCSDEIEQQKTDEIIIENRAWTQQEIQKYYTNALGRFATL